MTPEQRYFFDVFGYLHLREAIAQEDLTELLTHGTLTWKSNRDRRTLVLRYRPQHQGGATSIPNAILEKLLPETRELLGCQGYNSVKEIVKAPATAA